jgi:hypothetical protein
MTSIAARSGHCIPRDEGRAATDPGRRHTDAPIAGRLRPLSFRQYYNYLLNEPVPQVTVPAAVTLSGEPAYAMYPRSLAERVFTDLRHWNAPHRGGHFMAHEEPSKSPVSCGPSSGR